MIVILVLFVVIYFAAGLALSLHGAMRLLHERNATRDKARQSSTPSARTTTAGARQTHAHPFLLG
jgi:hypothetical protein